MVDKEKRCSRCGAVPGGILGPHIILHHIIPLSQGGEDIEENVEYLCRNCHAKAHYWNGKVDEPPRRPSDKLIRLSIEIYQALDSYRNDGETMNDAVRRLLLNIREVK